MPRLPRPLTALGSPVLAVLVLAPFLGAGCGGATPPPPAGDTFTYSATGLAPRALPVASGGCITILNGDTANHDVSADDLTACPELIGTTTLVPGEAWTWCGFQGGPKTCAFSDPTRTLVGGAQDPAFTGAIQVRAP
jgi:hypothetical protein